MSTWLSAAVTLASVCTSSADSGSSSSSTDGLARIALASAIRCRCPPDSDMPCSPILVSRPHGSSSTKSAWAAVSAVLTASSVASGTPSATFSRTLTENSVGSSKAQATSVRRVGQRELA